MGSHSFVPLILRWKQLPAKAEFRHTEDVNFCGADGLKKFVIFSMLCLQWKQVDVLEG